MRKTGMFWNQLSLCLAFVVVLGSLSYVVAAGETLRPGIVAGEAAVQLGVIRCWQSRHR